jgi:hypothetical protein
VPWERSRIVASLTGKGFSLEAGERDHDFLLFKHRGQTRGIFTKVSRGTGYKEYGDELLGRMCRQLQLTRKQLDQLIECTMNEPDYVQALRSRGVIREESRGT